jgi:glyoxylase-like metal-dependent hydrolase (beta-lactamase superfamily II)
MSDVYGKFELANAQDSDNLCKMEVNVIDLQFQGMPGVIAAYLVEGEGGHVLIETGPESTRESLLAGMRARGVEPGDLAGVFVTHIHLDHAGAAGWFAGQGVPVHVHEKGARHLVDPSRLVESARMVYRDRFDALWGEMVPAAAELVVALSDGAVTEIAGLSIEAISTPGHAFHHHVYRIGGAVFAGDAAGARLEGNPFTSVTSAPPQFDLEHTLASIERLRSLGPDALFLTHFGAVPDPEAHLVAYHDAVEMNAIFIRQRLEEGFDALSLQVAYEAFQFEQAFRHRLPRERRDHFEAINGAAMCADGIRLYWEKRSGAES